MIHTAVRGVAQWQCVFSMNEGGPGFNSKHIKNKTKQKQKHGQGCLNEI